MGELPVIVGAVDIGTNSMRLLITDGSTEIGRWVEVTGLGEGVDATGLLDAAAVRRTVETLARYGSLMDSHGVKRRRAVATSASRDAGNRDEFLDMAEQGLGVRPALVSGEEEARLSYAGATADDSLATPVVVSDIGGGSTEFVTGGESISIDIGSVRLTERHLTDHPPSMTEMEIARTSVHDLFAVVRFGKPATLVGVAGTWTSLAAIALNLPAYDRARVHLSVVTKSALQGVVATLANMTLEETAAIPALDPRRAPVILSGAIIAVEVMTTVGVDRIVVSEHDSLDAVAAGLLALP